MTGVGQDEQPFDVFVVGTWAVGLSVRVPRLPVIGETLMGDSFQLGPGGKGSNMATAVARQGGRVALVATVGDDYFGALAFRHLGAERIDTQGVRRVPGRATLVGMALVLPDGSNLIVGDAGASTELAAADVLRFAARIRRSSVVVVEFGAPSDAVDAALAVAAEGGAVVVLNPAPARPIAPATLARIDYLTPNLTEARIILGLGAGDESHSPFELAVRLRDLGPRTVIVTCGEAGCVVATGNDEPEAIPSYAVEAVDTVGAGDAFNGGLAAALARGAPGPLAILCASATAALSTTANGAVDGLPDLAAVNRLIAKFPRPEEHILG